MKKKSIAIVGAGLMGRMLAWNRVQSGDTVTLIDQTHRLSRASAGMTAAAMIAPYTEAAVKDSMICNIGKESLSLWPKILQKLENHTAMDIFYRENGTLVVAHAEDCNELKGFIDMVAAKLGKSCFQEVEDDDIRNIEPEIADRFNTAIYFPDEAVLSNESLFEALRIALENHDINWIEDKSISEISEVEEFGNFDWVIDCRGMGAAPYLSDLRGVRGELIRVFAPEVNLQRAIRLMHPRYPLYIAPHGNNHYVIGATEIESDALHPVTVRSGLELLSALYSVHPGFAEASIVSMEANCRPAYPDNLPKIWIKNNCISINGLYRHGFLFAPALIADVCNYLDGKLEEIHFNTLFEFEMEEKKVELGS